MKIRSQRTHFMGSSNRQQKNDSKRGQSVFERSFQKSKSLYYKSNKEESSMAEKIQRKNPFLGSHNEFETVRFNKHNIKAYREQQISIPIGAKALKYGNYLNSEVQDIREEFKNKRINLHKLKELKNTFVKNNRDRRNLKQYFEEYSEGKAIINVSGMKKIVKEYGFDINDDEAQLLFRLTNRNEIDKFQQGLNIGAFTQLMTKDDIYYKTLKINTNEKSGEYQNFSQPIHQVLRNKFPRLKQAFKIYISRGQEVNEERYKYVMKKLDITNLIMNDKERKEIFTTFSQEGKMNVERFLGAIAEQQQRKKVFINQNLDFIDQMGVYEEKNQKKNQKNRPFSLKNLSSLQYQNQLEKAQKVIDQLRRVEKQRKTDIVKQICENEQTNRESVIKKTERILKNQGTNFHKEEYDAFAAYLDFDIRGNLSENHFRKNIQENEKEARERLQRRVRNEAPKNILYHDETFDQQTALRSIHKLKNQKMNPENKQLFQFFDQDRDGYICTQQFRSRLESLKLFENWEINNLVSYMDTDKKGSVDYNTFTKKFNTKDKEELPFVRTKQSLSCQEWSTFKKTLIRSENQAGYQKPTRLSAWPQRLKETDLSLLQPSSNCGMHASERERFGTKKDEYAAKQKAFSQSIANNRVNRLAQWNKKLAERAEVRGKAEQDRAAANNYVKRLTKQLYQEHCHK